MSGPAPSLEEIGLERILALADRLDVRGPRYTSYPTVPVWNAEVGPEALERGLGRTRAAGEPIAVYLHLPFCRRRCLYCGCNSFVSQRADRMERYAAALRREADRVAAELAWVRHRQLHLGGGTPTHLPVALLAEVIDHVIARIPGEAGAERSIEVDPRVTTPEHLQMLRERGFSRLSAGVQDLDPAVQAAVQRIYPPHALEEFVASAREAGFAAVNLDLIYGLPKQTRKSWQATLAAIADLGPDRLACFGYAHLPKRLVHQRAIDEADLPAPRERLAMLVDANTFFVGRGYEAVGLDHFAQPDDELARARRQGRLWRNFMGYTTTRGLELLGLGSSAISELESLFVQNEVDPERYAATVEADRSPLVRGHELDEDDRYRKELINHLMCNLEVDLRPPPGADQQLESALAAAAAALEPYAAEGLLTPQGTAGYRVTPLGQLFLRNLAMPFDRYLPRQGGATFSRTV